MLLRKVLRKSGFDILRWPLEDWVHLRQALLRLFLLLNINRVIDVGGHMGGYGGFLRDIGYEGWIVSFEAVEDTHNGLRRRAANDPKWSVYNLALGAEDRMLPINVTKSRVFSSFFEPSRLCQEQF